MEKIIDKISKYHMVTNLIPGILSLYLINMLGIFYIDMSDVLKDLFVGYLAGMMISRISSVVIEPWFQAWRIVEYVPYEQFIKAEALDNKIIELQADNNMYRTFVAMFLLLLILYIGHIIPIVDDFMHSKWAILVAIAIFFVLYVLAFRKQTKYIGKRVKNANKQIFE